MLHRRYRVPAAAYGAVAILTLVLTVFLPATGLFRHDDFPIGGGETIEARVVEVLGDEVRASEAGRIHQTRLLVALDDGEEVELDHGYVEGSANAYRLEAGDRILVARFEDAQGNAAYTLRDRSRTTPLWIMSLAFGALVVAVGGRQGGLSLLGLGISFLVIVRFIVPGILAGLDPLTITVIGSAGIMAATLVVSHGANVKTLVALGGTSVTLVATALLAAFAVTFAKLSGTGAEDAATVQQLTLGAIDARGLLLSGIILGALGVLDDVTTTQASTILELRAANAALTARQLFVRGMNVGRDHIAATTNTLLLAYAGASLPLLLILAAQPAGFGVVISIDSLATEVVRTLAGSAGIVLAVPLTTALAAFVAPRIEVAPVTDRPGH